MFSFCSIRTHTHTHLYICTKVGSYTLYIQTYVHTFVLAKNLALQDEGLLMLMK